MYDNSTNTITFTLVARKNRREFIATSIKVAVAYVTGLDLYGVVVTMVDGESFDQTELANVSGVYSDSLSSVLASAVA